jgi:hypothetical protein
MGGELVHIYQIISVNISNSIQRRAKERSQLLSPPKSELHIIIFFSSGHRYIRRNRASSEASCQSPYTRISVLDHLTRCLKFQRNRTSKPPRKSMRTRSSTTFRNKNFQIDFARQYPSKHSRQQCSHLLPRSTTWCWYH